MGHVSLSENQIWNICTFWIKNGIYFGNDLFCMQVLDFFTALEIDILDNRRKGLEW